MLQMPTGKSARQFWSLSVACQGRAPLLILIPKGGATEPETELGLTQSCRLLEKSRFQDHEIFLPGLLQFCH